MNKMCSRTYFKQESNNMVSKAAKPNMRSGVHAKLFGKSDAAVDYADMSDLDGVIPPSPFSWHRPRETNDREVKQRAIFGRKRQMVGGESRSLEGCADNISRQQRREKEKRLAQYAVQDARQEFLLELGKTFVEPGVALFSWYALGRGHGFEGATQQLENNPGSFARLKYQRALQRYIRCDRKARHTLINAANRYQNRINTLSATHREASGPHTDHSLRS